MAPETAQRSLVDHSTRPAVEPTSGVDAALREQITTIAAELESRSQQAYHEQPPDPSAPCHELRANLDAKRKELQKHLDLGDELRRLLEALQAVAPPASNELRVRVLVLQGSLYDFNRLGKSGHRERLDRALQNAAQIFQAHWDITVAFGQPETIPKASAAWELTPDELWQLGQRYASEGTPALLFADRILMPDKTLPHSWGQADRSIACVTEAEWLGGGQGLITAHNLAHLSGLEDHSTGKSLASHDEPTPQLTTAQIKRMRQCLSQRTSHWIQENTAARQRAEDALDVAQRSVALLERQGDMLWQFYQACLEQSKTTPAYGVSPPALSRLAQDVERLAHQIGRVEKELASVKELLTQVQKRLREMSS